MSANAVSDPSAHSPVPTSMRTIRGLEDLAELLRAARRARGISQMDLAFQLGISQRHLSFVEIARAKPSRDLLMAWMDALEAPVSVRNAALHHAGLSAVAGRGSTGERMKDRLREGLARLIAAHDPFPAVVFDADWRAVGLNQAGTRLCRVLMPYTAEMTADEREGLDMIDAVARPDGLLARARRPEVAAGALIRQFETEVWTRPSLRARVKACRDALQTRYGHPLPDGRDPEVPALELVFDSQFGDLAFFIIQTVVGLPQNVTPDALRAELWFPADDLTREMLEGWAQ